MEKPVTIEDLYQRFQQRLGLTWLTGQDGAGRELDLPSLEDSDTSLIGHLNFIHPNLIQVIGTREREYLDSLIRDNDLTPLTRLMSVQLALAIITDGQQPPETLLQLARENRVPLLQTQMPSQELISTLGYMLTNLLTRKIILHGVYLEVLGSGVLLTGESSIGKSELALELITRGNRLIADDAPEFSRIAPDIISGTCPDLLREMLEVRGLGVLNIRAMFGDSAIKMNKYLRLIIRLINADQLQSQGFDANDRLHGYKKTFNVLGIEIPEITLPVAPGRNLAVLIETAVRNHMLSQKGYNAASDFIERQQRLIEQDEQ